ncbi:HeH/LEM domain-containing protein [Vitreoscilla massiliensis]|uniref:HeH/LEM domain-containing protein n=1 Tax=Vitreoscilla massiliensis TaxID=1689272 RepID=A0ABY4E147_9NEIS|nr:HeH/LEM domain-containing protein [Vitreoscilla massiliensis]UOO89514.1 HeH/LEM domain-containing protein [Vitreoscilla massiliensis]
MGLSSFNRMRREAEQKKPEHVVVKPDLSKLSVGELREHLAEHGVAFDPKASKAELLKLIEA